MSRSSKYVCYFKTVGVSKKLAPTKRYRILIEMEPTISSLATVKRVLELSGDMRPVNVAEAFLDLAIRKTAELVMEDLRPRYLGPLKIAPIVKGSVKSKYSDYAPKSLKGRVSVSFRKGFKTGINFKHVMLVNRQARNQVKIQGFATQGASWKTRSWVKGKPGCLWGQNLMLTSKDSIRLDASYWHYDRETKESTLKHVTRMKLKVLENTDECITCEWPEKLDEAPDGTRMKVIVESRGGDEDGRVEVHETKVYLRKH